MHATIRRYDGVNENRAAELTRKVNETLLPKLQELPGFGGYWLVDAGNGIFSSMSLFETTEQGKDRRSSSQRGPRRETQRDDPERAQDYERRGHRPQ